MSAIQHRPTRYQIYKVRGVKVIGQDVFVSAWLLSNILTGHRPKGVFHTPPYIRDRAHSLWAHQDNANIRIDMAVAASLGFTYCKICEKGDRYPRG